MSPDGLFRKHECGLCAVAIVAECERLGTWNVCFEVPNRGEKHHFGFSLLVHFGALQPVYGRGSSWVVTDYFLAEVRGRHSMPDALPDGHGMVLPGPEPIRGTLSQHGSL